MMKKSCVALILVGCLGLFALYVFIEDSGKIREWGIDADFVEWLPKEASEITYVSSWFFKVAEFRIDQDVFSDWCDTMKKPLKVIGEDQNVKIGRANRFLENCGAIKNSPINDSSSPEEYVDWYNKRLTAGDLFYELRHGNGGGYSIGYDTKAARAYYSYFHN